MKFCQIISSCACVQKNKECGCRISCNAALRALSVDLINTANCGAAMSTHTNIFGIISRIFHFLASKNISLKYHFKIHWRQSLWRKEKKTNFYQCTTLLLSTLVYFFPPFSSFQTWLYTVSKAHFSYLKWKKTGAPVQFLYET